MLTNLDKIYQSNFAVAPNSQSGHLGNSQGDSGHYYHSSKLKQFDESKIEKNLLFWEGEEVILAAYVL